MSWIYVSYEKLVNKAEKNNATSSLVYNHFAPHTAQSSNFIIESGIMIVFISQKSALTATAVLLLPSEKQGHHELR